MNSAKNADYHIHYFLDACARQDMTLPNIAEKARAGGFEEIAVLKHYSESLPNGEADWVNWRRIKPAQFKAYLEDIARFEAPGNLRIYSGVETELVNDKGDINIPAEDQAKIDMAAGIRVTRDLHIHTNLSKCGDPSSTAAACVLAAEKAGLTGIGFANHCWASQIEGASDFYQGQDLEHVLKIKDELAALATGLQVWVGCETEYTGSGRAGMNRELAGRLDYVFFPASHFHMSGYTVPEDLRSRGPCSVRELLYRRFLEVTELGFGTGIVHPFFPLGFDDWEEEVLSGITRRQYETCFTAAKQAGLAIEIHHSAVESRSAVNESGFSSLYIDMLTSARDCGCSFFFGSDAHNPVNIKGETYKRMGELAGICGIRENMILSPPFSRPG